MLKEILNSKIAPPQLRSQLVHRPRLIKKIDTGFMSGLRLVVVSAPAGSGKTTLLAEWSASTSLPLAWLSLDEDDNDPARLFRYLTAALDQLLPGLDKRGQAIFRGQHPPPLQELIVFLCNELQRVPTNLALILDDYHRIEVAEIHQAITYFLDHLPANIRLILATRSDPPLPFPKWRARGQLVEVRGEDLRFTFHESQDFLNRIMGLELSEPEIRMLETRTEGWAAGLQMAALSVSGSANPYAFIHSFSGSDRYVMDYLMEEVWQRMTPETQNFISRTAILGRLSAPLCTELVRYGPGSMDFSERDCQIILERLENENLFVEPMDRESIWFRYHPLFAELIHKRLHNQEPELETTLHRLASEWYEEHDFLQDAIEHAFEVEDYHRAAQLIEQAAESVFAKSQYITLLAWYSQVPDEVIAERPLLCIFYAAALLFSGQPLEQVNTWLERAVQCDQEQLFSGERMVIKALLATMQNQIQNAVEGFQAALKKLPATRHFMRALAAQSLGLTLMFTADLRAAQQALRDAAADGEAFGNALVSVVSHCHVAETLIQQGNLSQAEYEYRRALQIGTDEQGNSLPIVGLAWAGLAFLELERNHLDQADFLVDKGQVAIGGIGALNFLESYLVEARLSYARADRIRCVEKLHAARTTAARFVASMIDDLVVVMAAVRFHIGFGDLDSSRVLLLECENLYNKIVSVQSEIGRYWHFQLYLSYQITFAHLALAENKPEDVQERLAPLLDEATTSGYIYRAIEMLCLMALAAQSIGKMDKAITWIEKGLHFAEAEGIVRLFLDFGAPMTGLLYEAAARGVHTQAIGHILAGSAPLEKPDLQKNGKDQILEPLSKREGEVLQLIADGQTNSDIARILVIAPNTVKKHINNIFRKLCVASRTQAVAQARMLGLLK